MAPKHGAPSIRELQEILDELDKVKNEEAGKISEVERNYVDIRRAIYKRRNEIIRSIPDFWLTAFINHPLLCYLLTDDDRKILKYLILFDVNDRKDIKSGYSFTLKFSPNPYFEDACLRKTYTFHDDGIVTITGATIKWKEGMVGAISHIHFSDPGIDYTGNDDIHKKNDCKKVFSVESFFGWLSITQQLNILEWNGDKIMVIVKEDLWPNPLVYFKKKAEDLELDYDDVDVVLKRTLITTRSAIFDFWKGMLL